MMRLGALDFILKDSELLDLVVPIVVRGFETIDSRRRTEESLVRLDHISKTIKDVIWMMDADGKRAVYVSPVFESIWGFPAERLYDHREHWTDAIFEADRSKALRSFENLREGTRRDFDEVYRIRDKLGKIRWVRNRGYANYGHGGEIRNLTGVATEVTEYKALERHQLEMWDYPRGFAGRRPRTVGATGIRHHGVAGSDCPDTDHRQRSVARNTGSGRIDATPEAAA